jgi:hypothetical protein
MGVFSTDNQVVCWSESERDSHGGMWVFAYAPRQVCLTGRSLVGRLWVSLGCRKEALGRTGDEGWTTVPGARMKGPWPHSVVWGLPDPNPAGGTLCALARSPILLCPTPFPNRLFGWLTQVLGRLAQWMTLLPVMCKVSPFRRRRPVPLPRERRKSESIHFWYRVGDRLADKNVRFDTDVWPERN